MISTLAIDCLSHPDFSRESLRHSHFAVMRLVCSTDRKQNINTIHRFQKKPEVTPKRGLIALAVDAQSNKHGERSGKASLSSDNIPGVSVNEELTD